MRLLVATGLAMGLVPIPVAFAQIATNNPAMDQDVAFWMSVQASEKQEELQLYLDKFPAGLFADLAKTRIEDLRKKSIAAVPTPPAAQNSREIAVETPAVDQTPVAATETAPAPVLRKKSKSKAVAVVTTEPGTTIVRKKRTPSLERIKSKAAVVVRKKNRTVKLVSKKPASTLSASQRLKVRPIYDPTSGSSGGGGSTSSGTSSGGGGGGGSGGWGG